MAPMDDYSEYDRSYDAPRRVKRSRGPGGPSGKAIASLILGVLSFCTSVLTGGPAIILGIIGLSEMRRSQGRITGQGMAIAGIITGALGSICLLGCGGFMWFGTRVMAREMEEQLRDNPALVRELGTIPTGGFSYEWIATGAAQGWDEYVFHVRGSKGSGNVHVETDSDDRIVWAELRLPDGRKVTLVGQPPNRRR
jgi:hypothetical protein